MEDKIEEVAYRLWEEEGCPHGRDSEHWTMAVAIVKKECRCKSCKPKAKKKIAIKKKVVAKKKTVKAKKKTVKITKKVAPAKKAQSTSQKASAKKK